MGRKQSIASSPRSPSPHRFPPRTCYRLGCGRVFQPRVGNQRYCQEPSYLREVHRWQAAKRQRRRRQRAEQQEQHAQAERQRRCRQREAKARAADVVPSPPPVPQEPVTPRAWSRCVRILHDFCDRPGCYAPLGRVRRGPAQYCARACSQAARRVHERERKFKSRQQKAAERRAPAEDQACPSAAPRTISAEEWERYLETSKLASARVRTSPPPDDVALSSRDRIELPGLSEEISPHDPQTSLGHRSRAPPSG